MKITTSNLIRLAGFSVMLAGLCYAAVGVLHPANIPSAVTTTRWELVHVVACAMSFFGLLGMAGLYARQASKAGWLGLIGYVLLSLWLVLIMGFSFVEAFLLPHLAGVAPAAVTAWMGMFNGPAGTFSLGVLPNLWTLSGFVYIFGGLLFGIATIRARILPRLAGALLAVSTVVAPLAALLPNAAQPKTAIPMGIALAWLGFAVWMERRTVAVGSADLELVTSS
jgi:hypothetical protein